jgi:hypothetical protein
MKQKDNIEELIVKNLEGLNDNEPSAGHFERFEARLGGLQRRKKGITLSIVWKIAAAAVFAFLIVNQAVIWFSGGDGSPAGMREEREMTLASVSPEYEEVEFFYTNAINVGLTEWERMAGQGLISGEEQQMMEDELEEFEQIFKSLQSDLSANPNDERVINAMIEYYQTKLSLINMIIEKLQEVKQKNNAENETEL